MIAQEGQSPIPSKHSQPTLVLMSDGSQTLERLRTGQLLVTDGFLTNWITIYDPMFYDSNPGWKSDGPLKINKGIRNALYLISGSRV